jgi:hypothetical protein
MNWQAIDTAPSAEDILLYFAGGFICVGFFSLDDNQWWNDDGTVELNVSPTHWMPLPEPPTGE